MSKPNTKEELASAFERYNKEVKMVSSCCKSDKFGQYITCEKCGEYCVAVAEIPFQDWLEDVI